MSPHPEPLFGQCVCGGALTVEHLRYHCPLQPQQERDDRLRHHLWWAEFMANRLDTSNVAELGYN